MWLRNIFYSFLIQDSAIISLVIKISLERERERERERVDMNETIMT